MTDIIMWEDAAKHETKTVTGWFSISKRDGVEYFHGKDEYGARLEGATHRKCENCGTIVKLPDSICKECKLKRAQARWESLPVREWDGESPVVEYMDDKYFFGGMEEIEEYCDDIEILPENLMLVHCVPVYPSTIDEDRWADDLPEDGELPGELLDAVATLNEVIKKAKPISYYPGEERLILKGGA